VHDDVDGVVGEHLIQQRLVGEVALVQRTLPDELAASGREIVEDDDLVTCVLAGRCHGAADVAGSAGDEYLHVCLPGRRFSAQPRVDTPIPPAPCNHADDPVVRLAS